MYVLFVPDYSRGNPYQRELAEALRRCGVRVSLSSGIGPLPLLGAVLSRGKPDLLHLHWTEPFTASRLAQWISLVKSTRFVLDLLSLKVRGIRIVWTIHNLAHHEQLNPRIELLTLRVCARLYDQMIVHCRFAKDAVVRTYSLPRELEHKITVIPQGSYIRTYENSVSRGEARNRFGFDEEDVVFLFLGVIRPYKGVFHLVSAFGQLDHPRAQLLIVGRPANEALRKKLEDHLRRHQRIRARLAFIPDDEIQIYMNGADVVVLPYRDVLTSSSVLLAASFGKAVIAPRVGCLPEDLDSRGAFLYDANQEDALMNAMRQALNADLAGMGRDNFERAGEFDWDDIARKTYDVYQRCFA